MPRNVEIKARIADPETLERRVAELATEGPTELYQHDTFFAVAHGHLKLRRHDSGDDELIAYDRDATAEAALSSYVRASTLDSAPLLETLSELFGVLGSVRKRRRVYWIGPTRVHLDRVERLGDFLELEVVLEPDEREDAGRIEAERILTELGIPRADLVAVSYVDLLARQDDDGSGPEDGGTAPGRLAATALAAAVALGGCDSPAETAPESPRRPLDGTVTVIAHRGASAYAPEHTFPAWDLAIEMGADYLEQDLQMTADGHLVVLHDEELDRTAAGGEACSGPVAARTLAQLAGCEVGGWFAPDYAGEPIPTLAEVLGRYGGRARLYIETKSPEAAPGMEAELVRLLDAHGLTGGGDPSPVILQSFSPESLQRLAERVPALPRVQLIPDRWSTERVLETIPAIAAYAQGIGPAARRVDGRLVEEAHRSGLFVHPYTVNEPDEMERLFDLGVDGIFTDRPDVARERLDERD